MARWESDARGRLEAAAIELFSAEGFDHVTVPDITARAGLTTRTFFRYFADKREVLFVDSDHMPDLVRRVVAEAPPNLGPLEVVRRGLPAIAAAFDGQYEKILRRKAIIDNNAGLRERELHKMERVVDSMAAAFRDRGLDEPTSILLAETAVAVVKASLRQWFVEGESTSLEGLLVGSFDRVGRIYGSG